MDLPLISVIFITYKRIDLLKRTIDSFLENTLYPRERLELILCDDGSPLEIQEEMRKMPFDVFLLAETNQGLGANTNKGIRAAKGEYILQLQDDWILNAPNNYLLLAQKALSLHKDIAMMRFRLGQPYVFSEYLSIEDYTLKILSNKQVNKELNRFIYSDNPHLKRKNFHDVFGYYLEGVKMTIMEINMCDNFNRQNGGAATIDGIEDIFEHIGEDESFRTKTIKDKVHNYIDSSSIGRMILQMYKKVKGT